MSLKNLSVLLLGLVFSACSTTQATRDVVIDSELLLDAQNASIQHRVAKTYDSYTFLLITSPGWVASSSKLDLQKLRDSFVAFGNQIGKENLAVFFYDRHTPTPDTVTAARFAKIFDLDLSKGPYLVYFTPRHPRPLNFAIESTGERRDKLVPLEIFYSSVKQDFETSDSIFIDLNGISPTCTTTLLNNIQADLYWRKNPVPDIREWQVRGGCDTRTAAQKVTAWLLDVKCFVQETVKNVNVEIGPNKIIKLGVEFRSPGEARGSCGNNGGSANAR